jgi:hypothetical protein
MSSTIWRAALPMWKGGSPPWSPRLAEAAEKLRRGLDGQSLREIDQAVDRELRRRFDEFLRGIEAYRAHGYRRDLPDPATVWSAGTTRLLDYGAPGSESFRTVLLVPSLVNRSYVLDLAPRASLIRHLAAQSLRPILVDWGTPGIEERRFGLTDYIAGRLEPALEFVAKQAGGPVASVIAWAATSRCRSRSADRTSSPRSRFSRRHGISTSRPEGRPRFSSRSAPGSKASSRPPAFCPSTYCRHSSSR